MVYFLIRYVFGLAARLFYKLEPLTGRVPDEGACILVANHPNSLLDPILVSLSTRRPVRFLAKEPLFRMPVLSWIVKGARALPVYRKRDGADTKQNDKTFAAVDHALGEGDVVCIFPEGTSHSAPDLVELRTGVARMALSAVRTMGAARPVQIVPVGLHFKDKSLFRSVVTVEVGAPFDARDFAAPDDQDPADAVRRLMAEVEDRLRRVMVHAATDEDVPFLWLASEVYRGEGQSRDQALKWVAQGARRLRTEDPARFETLREQTALLLDGLQKRGLGPDHLDMVYTKGVLSLYLVRHTVSLLLGGPLALAGMLLYGLPFLLLRLLPPLLRAPRDMWATVRLLGGLVVFPLWHVALVVGLGWWLEPQVALLVGVSAPFLGLYAHAFVRRRKRMAHDARAFWALLRHPGEREELVRRRARLKASIDAARASLAG